MLLNMGWVEFADTTRQGHNLDSIKELIGSIIAYNDRRALLADFTTDRRGKINPPHITSLHYLCLQMCLRPTQGPRIPESDQQTSLYMQHIYHS